MRWVQRFTFFWGGGGVKKLFTGAPSFLDPSATINARYTTMNERMIERIDKKQTTNETKTEHKIIEEKNKLKRSKENKTKSHKT